MFAGLKAWFKRVFSHPVPVIVEAPQNKFPEPSGNDPELPDANDKGKVKVAVIVGHTKDAPGAVMAAPYNKTEYDFNTGIANAMLKFAQANYPQLDLVIIFRDGIGISGAYAKARALLCDVAIELHFNAFDGKASGSEVLCTPDSNDVEFAQIVQKMICEVFSRNGESRGVKTLSKDARGGRNVHSFPGGANCLVEPFFGDNPVEASLAMSHYDEYSEALVRAVAHWARQVDLIR